MSTSCLLGLACTALDATGPLDEPEAEALGTTRQSMSFPERQSLCAGDPRVVAGAVSLDICIGADLFLRETFNGNGRSCATCHRVDANFAIDPDFIARLPSSDPLFIAESNRTLAGLEIPAQMRRFGLILENVDGFLPDPRTRFTLRSVPHALSMATSVSRAAVDTVNPPLERTGWSGDGAPGAGSLRDFQTGAITQHYTKDLARVVGRDFRLADSAELDRLDLFMRAIGRTNEISIANVVMSDAGAEAGRARFIAVGCNRCHADAGANAGVGNRNFNTGVESARHASLASFPRDGGFLTTPANADGSFGDGTFNTPPLIEAADTGPFFHTATTVSGAAAHNAEVAETIEEAIAFYDTPAFARSPAGIFAPIDLTAADIDNIGRFLRGLNATFNIAVALKRLDAATSLANRFHNTQLAIQRTNLSLASIDLGDALRVLSEVSNLNATARTAITTARQRISEAQAASSESIRTSAVGAARTALSGATPAIGTNVGYTIGAGTIMF